MEVMIFFSLARKNTAEKGFQGLLHECALVKTAFLGLSELIHGVIPGCTSAYRAFINGIAAGLLLFTYGVFVCRVGMCAGRTGLVWAGQERE